MTQFAKPSLVATTDDGTTLSAKFNGAMNALYSMHAGAAAPPTPTEGQAWADTSAITANPKLVTFKTYQGGAWYPIGTLNMTTNLYSVTGGFPSSGGILTGPVYFPPGALATPSIAFDGDTDTGIWRPAAGQIAMSLNGVQEFHLTTSLLTLGGNLTLGSSTAPTIVLDSTGTGQRMIQAKSAGVLRWSMHLASSTAEGGANSGSPFYLYRYDDAGASLGIALGIDRATGNFGINSNYVAGIKMYVSTSAAEAVVEARNRFINANTAADVSVNLEFATAAGALRGKVRGQREGSTNHGQLILSSALSGVAQDVLVLNSDKSANFTGIVGATTKVAATAPAGTNAEVSLTVTGTRAWSMYVDNTSGNLGFFDGGTSTTPLSLNPTTGTMTYSGSSGLDFPGYVDGGGYYNTQMVTGRPAYGPIHLDAFHQPGVTAQMRFWVDSVLFGMRNDGTAYAPGEWQDGCDERVKTDITPITDALSKIVQIAGVTYQRTDIPSLYNDEQIAAHARDNPEAAPLTNPPARRQAGFLAQSVKAVLPEAITVSETPPACDPDGEGFNYLNSTAVLALAVQAIKEQQALISDLTARITALEGATP